MIILDRLKDARKHPHFKIMYGDVTDMASILSILNDTLHDPCVDDGPLEVYNLAAQSHVKVSFETPIYTANADGVGVLNMLQAIITLKLTEKVRFYQASTSELYGDSPVPQNEDTPFRPRSPYAVAKLYAYWIVRNYRDAYNMFAVNGILFNHESERRGETFVSRKITRAVAEHHHLQEKAQPLVLGNIYSLRDWGHANDYVQAMWKMLQMEEMDDYVIATNVSHTVKEFVELAFLEIGIIIRWEGHAESEKGYDTHTGKLVVCIDPMYYRLTEVNHLHGDATKANTVLEWTPIISFQQLVKQMVKHDILTHDSSLA
jgi:GDPmannose 4,6-dehydratase